jgi:hypothetical protein
MQRRALLVGGAALWACGSRPPQATPVGESAARRVLSPLRFGWLSSRQSSDALPSAIALGAETSGRVLLFFEFEELNEPRRLLRAELRLHTDGVPGQALDVELSRSEGARAELRDWSDQPQALYPRVSGRLSTDASPARLDVTELVRAQTKPGVPLRILLRAEPSSGAEPLLVRTGAAGGAAPELEAYWE